MKDKSKLKNLFTEEFATPPSDLVKYFAAKQYGKTIKGKVLEDFTELFKMSLADFLTDKEMIDEVIKKLSGAQPLPPTPPTPIPLREKISVTFPDGKVINCKNVTDTLVECIEKVGFEKVMESGIKNSGIPLVSKTKEEKPQRQIGEYWISTHSSSDEKIRILEKINKKLNLGLKIEKNSQKM